MGWWKLNADTLARSRFVISPFAETVASMKLLHWSNPAHVGERAWLDTHLPDYRARLAADPTTALLVRAGFGRNWNADFLTPAPEDTESFEEVVARVRSTDPASARAHLTVSLQGPLPAVLDRDDLPERAAALMEYVWTRTVRPYWNRRRRILEADVAARTARLGQGGWAAVLESLRPGQTRWLGEDRLQVNLTAYPPREIAGAELVFIPVTPKTNWVAWEEPHRYALVFACDGALTDPGARPVPAGLSALLGRGRAAVLVLLHSPMSTSQLVAVTGQGLGSVGRHLKILLEAGLTERRRAGRQVRYSRTAAGDALVEAASGATSR